MWSFREGLGLLIDTLRARLRHPPVAGASVQRVRRDAGGWLVELDGHELRAADAVALTCPAHLQSTILGDLDAALASEIGGIAYNRVAVVALGYRSVDIPSRLDGFGYLTPGRERRDVLGVQWCSSIFPERAPTGHALLRAMCGGWHRPELVDWDDDRLLGTVRAELAGTLGIRAAAVVHQVVRWDRAIPQYHLGHLGRLARIEGLAGRHPGLYLGGNAYRGVALNDCVEQAGRLAERVASEIRA
jgi:oxygen-dependent protoporphyrinogen oxidase